VEWELEDIKRFMLSSGRRNLLCLSSKHPRCTTSTGRHTLYHCHTTMLYGVGGLHSGVEVKE